MSNASSDLNPVSSGNLPSNSEPSFSCFNLHSDDKSGSNFIYGTDQLLVFLVMPVLWEQEPIQVACNNSASIALAHLMMIDQVASLFPHNQ